MAPNPDPDPDRDGDNDARPRRSEAGASLSQERLVPLARSKASDREVTIYVKGFLGRGELPEYFDPWLDSHRALVDERGWGPRAYGYCWPSGRLGGASIPVATAAKVAYDAYRLWRTARKIAVASAVGFALAEQAGRLAIQFVGQYNAAASSATLRAELLARRIARLTERYEHVRVVGHSLGCLHVIEAVAQLPPAQRPHEIHLCAPASREADVAEKLHELARERAWLYYAGSDLVLETGFRLMARGRALGAVGLRDGYDGLRAIDASPHFGFWVHSEYKHKLRELAAGDAS